MADFSSIAALPAAAFLALGLFVIAAGRGSPLFGQLLLVALAGIAWSARVFWQGMPPDMAGSLAGPAGFPVEFAFLFAWFVLLYRLLRGPYKQSMPETVRRALYLFWAVLVLSGVLLAWFSWLEGRGADAAGYRLGILLTIALLCFALSAQLKKDAPLDDQRASLSFAVAAALVSGVQALVFGIALLSAAVPPMLQTARILVTTVSAALIIYAVSRRAQWSLAIFVSPQARTYAPRISGALAILLLMFAAMPLVRALPPAAAQVVAATLILVVMVPVAVLVFSEDLSAKLRVFISKHFLPFRYDYREEWLRLIDTLASPEQKLPLPERSIKALAQIVGSPAGVLWLCDADNGPFHCAANWNTRAWIDVAVARDDPALEFMRQRQWILDTAELRRDPALYQGLNRPDWLEHFPDALLIVPLISNEAMIGFIVLFQSSSAFRLTFEEIDLLRTSGRQVAAHLAQYQADQQLAESQQFEALNRLTAFVMHDLKNLIAQQSLMVKNAARHKGNPEFFEDAMATIDNSVARMNNLLRQLQRGDAGGPRQRVRVGDALREAVAKADNRTPEPRLEINGTELCVDIDRDRFTSIVAHLIRNAQEATDADGSVSVSLREEKSQAVICIEDNGCGMDSDFLRNRLFRPFDSTKGSKGMGIGAYQARTFVAESGGAMDVQSAVGEGTRIVISLPLARETVTQ